MALRISRFVLAAIVVAGVFRADVACAQMKTSTPLQLTSLEWLVADNDVIVRGVVVDVAAEHTWNVSGNLIVVPDTWNIVTLDVRETLKGAKVQRLQFAVHKFEKGDAVLAQAKQSKREMLWILKRQVAGVPGEAPNREMVLARHKIDLHAPFLPGRPGEPSLPAIPVGQAFEPDSQPGKADLQGQKPVAFVTIDLRVLKTSDEIVKAIRTAIAEPVDACPCEGPAGSYSLALPQEVAQQTGFSRGENFLTVPVDVRLEGVARRFVQSPGDFFGKHDPDRKHMLRLEGVKALRLFPSEKNLAIVRAWLDNPMSTQSFKVDLATLVPAMPKSQQKEQKVVLPQDLAQVPEVHFQQPLTKAMKTADAQLHTAVTIDGVNLLNQKKTDAYIEGLMKKRPDLAGLSFAMGDSCRMKPEVGRKFVAALEVFRNAPKVKMRKK